VNDWTDGTFFDFHTEHLGWTQNEKFAPISREGHWLDCKRLGLDMYSLAKLIWRETGDVRKLHPSDFGWYEVPPNGPPPRARKSRPRTVPVSAISEAA
jgi:hypothetical protein